MNELPNNLISFAEFELDTVQRKFFRDGEVVPLHSKAFDLLTLLVKNRGRVVSKDEILDSVWEGSFVEESNLLVQISNLRKALGEAKNSPRFLITIPGKGYKFIADIDENDLIIETHSFSELTIEQKEIVSQSQQLPQKTSSSFKWLSLALISLLIFLTLGGIIFWFQSSDKEKGFALGWTDPNRQFPPRQLTAKGNINVAAISPDGTLYAYTNEGGELAGLWVSGISSPQDVEILPLSAINFQGLTFSPDGLHIYYTAREAESPQNSLFRVPTLGGRSEKILSDLCCAPTFSPNGKEIAFIRADTKKKSMVLITANLQTKEEKEITLHSGEIKLNDNGVSWSPDGKKIAVGGIDENTKENGVLLVDVETGKAEKFGEKAWTYVRRVEWLPDGSGLLVNAVEKEFWQERKIWMLEYPGGKAHKITNDLNRYGRETASVSADGTKIIGVMAQTISNIFLGNAENLEQINRITNNAVGKNDGQWNGLTWTTNGKIVFMRFFDKSDTLWVMDEDGTNQKQLTSTGFLDRKPNVTSDNRYVVFYSTRGGSSNIWRVDLDGQNLKQITFDGGNFPSITPDGKWVYYQKDGRIRRISIDGGESVQVTNAASKAVEVSPDGKMFACFYRLKAGEKLKLAVFPIDGGEPIKLFDVPVDLPNEKLRWMPDGKSLVYAFYNSIAWKQNLSGGTPEKFLEFPDEIINGFAWSSDGKKFAIAHGQELRDAVLFSIEK